METTPPPRVERSAADARPRWPRTAALLGAGAVLAALLLPVWPALRLSDGGDTLGHLRLAGGGSFTVSYVHSIDGLPIEENLLVRDGRLVVDSTRVRQFGAGMGHVPGEGTGRADGEWWVVEGMERDIGTELTIRVGAPAVDHRIRAPGAEVRLSPCLAAHPVRVEPVLLPTLLLPLATVPEPEC
ncbi:DUF1850 domain-containing protein [Nocardiopsis sp. NPDC101807]|uniref:DUF1850 domain-containing protein n=1 Tax=Nocardiopsis sp. NPDC101807 TaxID=3364339 RepID=UPI0037F59F79